MLLSGELWPGQHVRQADIAARLNVSRVPVREAIAVLAAEGVFVHEPHAGYAVAKFDAEELAQIYWMRSVLETRLVESIDHVPAATLAAMERHNRDVSESVNDSNLNRCLAANSSFHFDYLNLSPLRLVIAEVRRLWSAAAHYHPFYLYDRAAKERIVKEHADIVSAIRADRKAEVISLLHQHREHARSALAQLLPTPSLSPGDAGLAIMPFADADD